MVNMLAGRSDSVPPSRIGNKPVCQSLAWTTSARQLGLTVVPLGVQSADDIAPAFGSFKGQVGAIYLVENALIDRNRTLLIALAL